MASQVDYEIIITKPARDRFQTEILSYIEQNFSLIRAIEIENKLAELLLSLRINPQRGSVEKSIKGKDRIFRFILLQETKYLELKIVYFINELEKEIQVTDFFLTKMNPSKMRFS